MKKGIGLLLSLALLASPVFADEQEVKSFLKTIFDDNAQYVLEVNKQHFDTFSEEQNPRATIVTCSDSRIQADAFHKSPVNDLFFIRNIGNQIITTAGSVEYGINHLHTPILLIVGHSHCGAINAALGDYSHESTEIIRELNHLHLRKAGDTNNAVVENVHNQVDFATKKYHEKISKKELLVVGAVYDFRDDFHHGHGKLILINLNGEKEVQKLKKSPYLSDIKDLAIGYSPEK